MNRMQRAKRKNKKREEKKKREELRQLEKKTKQEVSKMPVPVLSVKYNLITYLFGFL